jgi:hypothetical protein
MQGFICLQEMGGREATYAEFRMMSGKLFRVKTLIFMSELEGCLAPFPLRTHTTTTMIRTARWPESHEYDF